MWSATTASLLFLYVWTVLMVHCKTSPPLNRTLVFRGFRARQFPNSKLNVTNKNVTITPACSTSSLMPDSINSSNSINVTTDVTVVITANISTPHNNGGVITDTSSQKEETGNSKIVETRGRFPFLTSVKRPPFPLKHRISSSSPASSRQIESFNSSDAAHFPKIAKRHISLPDWMSLKDFTFDIEENV